jgi:hypothetical protein
MQLVLCPVYFCALAIPGVLPADRLGPLLIRGSEVCRGTEAMKANTALWNTVKECRWAAITLKPTYNSRYVKLGIDGSDIKKSDYLHIYHMHPPGPAPQLLSQEQDKRNQFLNERIILGFGRLHVCVSIALFL